LLNQKDGAFSAYTPSGQATLPDSNGKICRAVTIGDVNGDNRPDLIVDLTLFLNVSLARVSEAPHPVKYTLCV
jgi:hypothetical protein